MTGQPAVDHALAASLQALAPMLAGTLRDPWWVIGSAAARLSGVDGFAPADIDLLLSRRDAKAFTQRHEALLDRDHRAADEGLFRSCFARLQLSPLPVEVMGGLQVRHDGAWRDVVVADSATAECGGHLFPVPSLREQVRLFELFGRDKDLDKARRLRRYLREHAAHAV